MDVINKYSKSLYMYMTGLVETGHVGANYFSSHNRSFLSEYVYPLI